MTPFQRTDQFARLTAGEVFDVVVIGGGATGAGVAVDAASRGFRVALVDQADFGKGTSSRSTKLVHGGVRYLEQGDVCLVRDALRERGLLRRNAPHLVRPLATVVPLYRWWEPAYYRAGLVAYDLLAGRLGFGRSSRLSRDETLAEIPTLNPEGLRGGVRYFDGAFDDARLLIDLVMTAAAHDAACVNYTRVDRLVTQDRRVVGVEATDLETGASHEVRGRVVVNAAGPFGDTVRRMSDAEADAWIQPSQGAHLVVDRTFLPTDAALIVPRTPDGRVVFAIPWRGSTLIGTTDTALEETPLEPRPFNEEIEYLLESVADYLIVKPERSDVKSAFAGVRPLVRRLESGPTSKLGRDHEVRVDDSGLVSVLGGKWTTYRKMAEDAVDRCIEVAGLKRSACRTADLPIGRSDPRSQTSRLDVYGDRAADVRTLIAANPWYGERLAETAPYTVGEATWAVRAEMARTVEDVLSRRLRLLPVNAEAALRAAPRVAQIVATELERDADWVGQELSRFEALARGYAVSHVGVETLPSNPSATKTGTSS